jgi:hypothetical protein
MNCLTWRTWLHSPANPDCRKAVKISGLLVPGGMALELRTMSGSARGQGSHKGYLPTDPLPYPKPRLIHVQIVLHGSVQISRSVRERGAKVGDDSLDDTLRHHVGSDQQVPAFLL